MEINFILVAQPFLFSSNVASEQRQFKTKKHFTARSLYFQSNANIEMFLKELIFI